MHIAIDRLLCRLHYEGKVVSVNEWKQPRRGGGMMLTPRYRRFVDDLALTFREKHFPQTFATIDELCYALVILSLPNTWDSSNITKPLFDALQAAGIVSDDKLIRSYTVARTKKVTLRGQGAIDVELYAGGELSR